MWRRARHRGEAAESFWTLTELAERAGVALALLEALEREGVLVPRRQHDEARYTEADLVALQSGLKLLEYGLPLGDVLDLAREHQQAARLIAERAVALFDRHIRQARRDDGDAPAELVEAFRVLMPATVALVAHHFRRILLTVAQEHIEAVGDDDEVAAVRTETQRRPRATDGGGGVSRRGVQEAMPQGADKARVVEEMFDVVAPRYDLVNRVMTFGLDRRWRRDRRGRTRPPGRFHRGGPGLRDG